MKSKGDILLALLFLVFIMGFLNHYLTINDRSTIEKSKVEVGREL